MIADASRSKREPRRPQWQHRFLNMLPAIRQYALFRFRNLPPEAREEVVQETIANCCLACCRLAQRHKLTLAHSSPLARFAVAQVRAGRKVGCRLNVRDVLSDYARRRNGFQVERLDNYDAIQGQWCPVLVADRHTPVDEQAAFRIDFPAWLTQLAPQQRQIAKFLAVGNSTSEAARHFQLSWGRISQLRRELFLDWRQFHGE